MDDFAEPAGRGRSRPIYSSRRRHRRSGHPVLRVLGVLLVLAVLGALGWLWLRSRADSPPGPETAATAPDRPAAAAADSVATLPLDLPELSASDELVRSALAALSERPQWAAWLVTDDLVRRFVISVVEVAEGRSPRAHVGVLAPEGEFRAQPSGDLLVVDPRSYRRYDALAATFASLDTRGTARLFRDLKPLMEDAYRELGLPRRTFDETVAEAFDRVLSAGVPPTPPVVEAEEGAYVYSAPGIESLTPIEKHLVRMGPENARRVQGKLRELATALGVVPGGG